MSFSVVIPTKNEAQYLPALLQSLREQTVQPDAVAIGDGDSTDATRGIAEQFGVKVVDGGSAALGRNAGASETVGNIIIFFDADAIIGDQTFLAKALAEFNARRLDTATADIYVENGSYVDRAAFALYNRYVRLWGNQHPHLIGTCIMVRRSVHDAIGGFDASVTFAEDHDYGLRAKKSGAMFGVLNSVRVGIPPRRQRTIGQWRFLLVNIFAEPYIMVFGSIKSRWFGEQYEKKKNKK